ncbi:tryptophan synthase beta chain 2, chloroplastic [Tanacetum coccineum]|uniref:Tryptophan synthase beta chain 2, chloroplastic n=1 Tax=Tanacetum coccineum TaxID=301880 RepID=A0ABQ4WN08_9ASTR
MELTYRLGVEAAGHDLDSGKHAITLTLGEVRVLHRAMSYLWQDDDGPHPYPMMVHEFQAVIGKETRKQALKKWGGKPDVLVACVGGGLNAMGLFQEFVDDKEVSCFLYLIFPLFLDSNQMAVYISIYATANEPGE